MAPTHIHHLRYEEASEPAGLDGGKPETKKPIKFAP